MGFFIVLFLFVFSFFLVIYSIYSYKSEIVYSFDAFLR